VFNLWLKTRLASNVSIFLGTVPNQNLSGCVNSSDPLSGLVSACFLAFKNRVSLYSMTEFLCLDLRLFRRFGASSSVLDGVIDAWPF